MFTKNDEITVVIATLGGDCLASTIQSLNLGSIKPAEILVCIPSEKAPRVKFLNIENVTIVETNFRGQVAQRREGFLRASSKYVLQLDDDIILDVFCLENLLVTLQSFGPKAAVAPTFIDERSNESVYKKPAKQKDIFNIYHWFMNGSAGYRPGQIDLSGSSIGMDPTNSANRVHDVGWLAGGCILHYRDNLILENFWPLAGKAYYEDVVHSILLTRNGVQLVIDRDARCFLKLFSQNDLKLGVFFRNLYQDYLGRKYFMHRFSRESFRIYLYYVGRLCSYFFSYLR